MKIKKLSICIQLALILGSSCVGTSYAATQGTLPSGILTNNSPFHFFLKYTGYLSRCPKTINPGQTTGIVGQCGYLVCATNQYDQNNGCQEFVTNGSSKLTDGGYLAYVSLAWAGGLSPQSCTIGANWYPYACNWDPNSNNLNFSYKSIEQAYSAGKHEGQKVKLGNISNYQQGPAFRGINISGLEYDGTFLDALFQMPDLPDMLYFSKQGMNTVRLPIRWEFLISEQGDAVTSIDPMSPTVNSMYMNAIYDVAQKYLQSGLTVDLDLHNYMRFCSAGIAIGQGNEPTDAGSPNSPCVLVNANQLAYIWGVIATKFQPLAQEYPHQLIFGLMNEPFSIDNNPDQALKVKDLFADEVAAIKTIRGYGLQNLILLSGDYWDPLHGWTNGQTENLPAGDLPNGEVFTAANLQTAGIHDLSNIAIEMHQYFDSNWSGTHPTCQQFNSYDDFKQKLALEDSHGNDIYGNWLKANNMKVFLSEFGAADNPTCQQDVNYMLQFVTEHAYNSATPANGGFIGWTAWRANKHGYTGFSPFNFLQTENDDVYGDNGTKEYQQGYGIAPGQDVPLMTEVFSNYLQKPSIN